MSIHPYKPVEAASALAIAALLALGASPASANPQDSARPALAGGKSQQAAQKHVADAVSVVKQMAAEPGMKELLSGAKGVFIAPRYGRAAIGIGGAGGAGVLLVRQDADTWSDPAFYNMGGISLGAQLGAEGGPVAFVLNNQKAVDSFRKKNAFTLSADAGLTIVDWNKTAQGTAGLGDVVAWAGTKGLFGNVASIAVSDIRFNQKQTDAFYGKRVALADVMAGKVHAEQASALKEALGMSAAPTAP